MIPVKALLIETYKEGMEDGVPQRGAALAYYTVFSIAPLLLITISIAGLIFGKEAVRGQVFTELRGFLGAQGALFVESVLAATSQWKDGITATIIGIAIVFLGATGFFAQFQTALNAVWQVKRIDSASWTTRIFQYWWSFTMVLGTGFLLLVSLVLSAFLNSVTQFASNYLALTSIMLEIVHTVFSFAMITLLFGLIFKIVPNVHIRWRDVWPAAFVTAILFTIGKFVLGLYLGRESVTSPYGAAGALVLVLLWSYYSAQILLFGAEFAQVYVRYRGSSVHPAKGFDFMTPLQIQDQPLTTQPGSRK